MTTKSEKIRAVATIRRVNLNQYQSHNSPFWFITRLEKDFIIHNKKSGNTTYAIPEKHKPSHHKYNQLHLNYTWIDLP